jgi:ABC-type nitrate/sulfonate/bicarbonate transport system permease component
MRMTKTRFQMLVFGGLVLAWEGAVWLFDSYVRFPHPLGVLRAAVDKIGSGRLIIGIEQSLSRMVLAFSIALAVGCSIGVLIATVRRLDRALSPLLDTLRSIAPIAWIPMAVLWFGVSGGAAIFIVFYAALFPILVNTAQAVRLVDRTLIRAAHTLGAGRWLILRRVILPGALPTVMVGARISLGWAWGSIIAAELAMGLKLDRGASIRAGLGQLMVNTLFLERDINGLVLYMATIGLISLAIDQGFRELQRRAMPWQRTRSVPNDARLVRAA